MLIRRIARPLLATAFVATGVDTLRNSKTSADAARPLLDASRDRLPDDMSARLPDDAETLVKVNAAVQIGGGLLLATGKAPRLASLALAVTLVPANLGSNAFWNQTDPQRRAQERTEFLTGLSLLGGLLIAAVDTEGKPSLGWRGRRAARSAAATVSAALPFGAAEDDRLRHGAQVAADVGRKLAAAAGERGHAVAEAVREHGPEWAEAARERGQIVADVARERGQAVADTVREHGPEWADAARERGQTVADAARERSHAVADTVREHGPEWAEAARERRDAVADAVREHGPEWAEAARARGQFVAEAARERAETAQARAAHFAERNHK